jgi:hypothetical protein
VESIAEVMLLGGMAITCFAQIIGMVLVVRLSILKGVLSLVVPGYFLFILRHNGIYWKVVGLWLAGIMGIVLGTILLS